MEALVRGPILEKSLKEEQNAEIYILFEIKTIFKFNLCISLSLLPTSECRMTQNPVSVMAYEEEQYCLLIRILKPPPWKDLCHYSMLTSFILKLNRKHNGV